MFYHGLKITNSIDLAWAAFNNMGPRIQSMTRP